MEPIDEVLAYLKENPTYYLATVDANGNPQVRPFGTIAKFDGRLIIQTGNSKAVFKEMMAHPRIAISAASADGTSWLRLSADAVRDDRREARVAALADYPELHRMYDPDDGNCEAVVLENVSAAFCDYTGAPRVVEF